MAISNHPLTLKPLDILRQAQHKSSGQALKPFKPSNLRTIIPTHPQLPITIHFLTKFAPPDLGFNN
jgi:hypothetical protein